MFPSFAASSPFFPTVEGQRPGHSSHNSSLSLCESQVEVPTRCSSQTSPRCFCLGLCWSSVWGALPDTICLCSGFQRAAFWRDPPVRAPTHTPTHRPLRWSQLSVGLPRLPREKEAIKAWEGAINLHKLQPATLPRLSLDGQIMHGLPSSL